VVVSLVSGLVPDELDDQREDRDREHEGREEKVELRDHPDRDAAADHRERAVLGLDVRFRLVLLLGGRRFVRDPLLARGRIGGVRPLRLPVLAGDEKARDADHREQREHHQHDADHDLHLSDLHGVPFRASCAWRSCSSFRTWAMIAQRSLGGIGQRYDGISPEPFVITS